MNEKLLRESPVQTGFGPKLFDWLRTILPLAALLILPTPCDPVRGIALPVDPPVQDASAISAYYLSFYE